MWNHDDEEEDDDRFFLIGLEDYILKGFRLKNSKREKCEKGGFDDISAPKTKKSRNSAN